MNNNYKEFPFDLTQTIPFKNIVFLYDCGLLPYKIIDYRDKFITSDKCPSTYADVIRTLTVNGFSFNFNCECDKCVVSYFDDKRTVRGKTIDRLLHNLFNQCFNMYKIWSSGDKIKTIFNTRRDPYPINFDVDDFHKRKCSYYVIGDKCRTNVIKIIQYLTLYHLNLNLHIGNRIYYTATDNNYAFYVNRCNEVRLCRCDSEEFKKIKRNRMELKWSDVEEKLKSPKTTKSNIIAR